MTELAQRAPHAEWGMVEEALGQKGGRTVVRVPEGLDYTEALAQLAGRHLGEGSHTHVFFGMRPSQRSDVTRVALRNGQHRKTILEAAFAKEKVVKCGVGRLLVSLLALIPGRRFSLALVDDPFFSAQEASTLHNVARAEQILLTSTVPHLEKDASILVVVSGKHKVEGGDLADRLKAHGWKLLELE